MSTIWEIGERRERVEQTAQGDCARIGDCDPESLHASIRAAVAAEDMVNLAIWQVGLGVLGLLGVGLTVLFAGFAWREAQRSADTQERALTASSRPYLVSDGTWLGDVRTAGEKPFRFKVTNFGAGPAFVRRFYIGILIDAELPVTPSYPYLWDVNSSVPPNGLFASDDSQPVHITLTAEDSQAILNGSRRVFVYGVVEYTDIRRAEHRTRFAHALRLYSSHNSDTFVVAGDPAYWENT